MRDVPNPGVARPGSVAADSRAGWMIAVALFVTGLAVFAVAAMARVAPSLRWVGGVFLLAAFAEAAAGLLLFKGGRSGVAYILGGALTLFFGVYTISRLSERPHAIALLFGLYLVMNATFRVLELAIERPTSWPYELMYVVTAFVLALILMTGWGGATARLVAAAIGIELVARGLALFGGARARIPRETDPVAASRHGRTPIVF